MREWLKLPLNDEELFVNQLVEYSSIWNHFMLLNSHKKAIKGQLYSSFQIIAACDSINSIEANESNAFEFFKKYNKEHKDWIFGHLSYDLKNAIENLTSSNPDAIGFPGLFFFIPKYVIIISENFLKVGYLPNFVSKDEIKLLINKISEIQPFVNENLLQSNIDICHNYSKLEYIKEVEKIQEHIVKGDIYELNFCTEFLAPKANINPSTIYKKLSTVSPAPFSGYYKLNDKYVLSSSPERFMAKRGTKLISQPIKGTIKRGKTEYEDEELKEKLRTDEKERAENIMIVDLVRNDLSRTAKQGSVKVEELCEIYSYQYVHQMISTIVSELDIPKFDLVDAIKDAFPMGSMTGAPKIRAMELIEKYEKAKRGLYSGCIGYINPEKNFDFNVIIRSILYDSANHKLSFSVGSAITFKSIPENEYNECLLKAEAMKIVIDN